jgi:hypothetical protein
MEVALTEAKDFVGIVHRAFSNDALMGLLDCCRSLIEHVVHAPQDDLGLFASQVAFLPVLIKHPTVTLRMIKHRFAYPLHGA